MDLRIAGCRDSDKLNAREGVGDLVDNCWENVVLAYVAFVCEGSVVVVMVVVSEDGAAGGFVGREDGDRSKMLGGWRVGGCDVYEREDCGYYR